MKNIYHLSVLFYACCFIVICVCVVDGLGYLELTRKVDHIERANTNWMPVVGVIKMSDVKSFNGPMRVGSRPSVVHAEYKINGSKFFAVGKFVNDEDYIRSRYYRMNDGDLIDILVDGSNYYEYIVAPALSLEQYKKMMKDSLWRSVFLIVAMIAWGGVRTAACKRRQTLRAC